MLLNQKNGELKLRQLAQNVDMCINQKIIENQNWMISAQTWMMQQQQKYRTLTVRGLNWIHPTKFYI